MFLTMVILLHVISPGLSYFVTGSLCLLTTSSILTTLHPPTSGNHQSVLCIYELDFKKNYLIFFLTRVTLTDEISLARDKIGAAAVGLHHSRSIMGSD